MAVPSISRAAAMSLVGGVTFATCLVVVFAIRPDLTFEMDRDLPPRLASGFYPVERSGDLTFAWTSSRARMALIGADRRSPWQCSVRFRAGRSDQQSAPVVEFLVDGIALASKAATNDYQDLDVIAPARPGAPGLTLALVSSTTFVPGPSDPRELGVQVDRLACRPAGATIVLPPRRAISGAALAGAVLGAAIGLAGFSTLSAIAGILLLAAAAAIPLSSGPAPYTPYTDDAARLAVWIALSVVIGTGALELWRRQSLQPAARFVVTFSAGALYLKLLALLHPSKLVIDAVFHAHRLEWVLSGRYYFTQPLPDGVQFPYAIALYLFAAPWAVLARDHVALLRIVVSASEAFAGALLYLMIVRSWGDKLTGIAAVVLFHVVPLPYGVVGNANLTNAFGQSAALVAIVAATTWSLRGRNFGQVAGLILLTTLALLSHVSTFALLTATLMAMATLYLLFGGPSLRSPAAAIVVALALAVGVSVVSYYAHFGDEYKTLARVRAQASATTIPGQPSQVSSGAPSGGPSSTATAPTPGFQRVTKALAFSLTDVGWPILLLAAVGLWRLWSGASRDRLLFALAAWGVSYVAFVALGTVMPVGARFERYAAEFVSRVDYATYPAAVILAAYGGVWAWRAGLPSRIASSALLVWAVVLGAQEWMRWLDLLS